MEYRTEGTCSLFALCRLLTSPFPRYIFYISRFSRIINLTSITSIASITMESTTASSPLSSRIPGPTNVAVFHRSDELETLQLGPISIHVLEDGSRTETRLGVVTLGLAPFSTGPPQHWHEMHDKTFLVTKGRVKFTTTTYAEADGGDGGEEKGRAKGWCGNRRRTGRRSGRAAEGRDIPSATRLRRRRRCLTRSARDSTSITSA